MRKASGNRFIILLLLIFVQAGCGGDQTPAAGPGAIQLQNGSHAAIDRFYIVPSEQTSPGMDVIMDLLSPGASMTVGDLGTGHYDAKIGVNAADSDYFAYLYDIPVRAGSTVVLTVADSSFTGSLEIRNQSPSRGITGVYVVRTDETAWSDNQTSAVIAPAGVLHLYDLDPGQYKIKIVRDDLSESVYDGAAAVEVVSLALAVLDVN